MKKVNSTMVARLAGVSQGTVSLVANNSARVSDETRRKVIDAARVLGYPLRQCRNRMVGVIVSRRPSLVSYRMMMLAALLEEASARNCRVEVVCCEDIGVLNDRTVTGAIDISIDRSLVERWETLKNLPLVRLFGRGAPAANIYSVYPDSRRNMRQVVDFLRGLGHRRIGALLYHSESWECELSLERNGLELIRCFASAGISPLEEPVVFSAGPELSSHLDRMLSRGVTALVAIPGDFGIRVCSELARRGVRIPEEFSVVTLEYGGLCENWIPPLTALSRDYRSLAGAAFDLLDRVASGESAENIALPGTLLERGSTAPPPAALPERE